MTADSLKKIGVPARYHNAILDLHRTALTVDAIKTTARTMLDIQAAMTPEARAAIHTSLMALTPGMAATQAGCSRKTIDNAIRAGKITATRGSTGLVSLDKKSFEAWKNARLPSVS